MTINEEPNPWRANARLGIAGLPDDFALLARSLTYGIALDDASVRLAIIAHTLQASLLNGRPCLLILARPPPSFIRKARLCGIDLTKWLGTGQLRIYTKAKTADSGDDLQRIRAALAQLLEAPHCRDSLVIMERADADFCLPEPGMVASTCELYGQWLERTGSTLLGFFDLTGTSPKLRVSFQRLIENAGGFARIVGPAGKLRLDFANWCGANGVNRPASFPMELDNSRIPTLLDNVSRIEIATRPMDTLFIATRHALDNTQPGMQIATDLVLVNTLSDVADLIKARQEAVVLLHFDSQQWEPLLGLALAVHSLRRPGIRLVVRERQQTLRAYQAAMLMQLGVAAIIPRGFTDAQVRVLLNAQAGTMSLRHLQRDIARVPRLSVARPAVLSPNGFRHALELLIADSNQLQLPQTLMVVPGLAPDVANFLLESIVRGMRDVRVSQTSAEVLIYLFSCQAAHARAAVGRAVQESLLDHSSTQLVTDDVTEIRHYLRGLSAPPVQSTGSVLKLVRGG